MSTKGLTKDLIQKDSIPKGVKYFGENGSQNYLVFWPVSTYFNYFGKTGKISSWRSKEMSEESIKNAPTAGNSFHPEKMVTIKI